MSKQNQQNGEPLARNQLELAEFDDAASLAYKITYEQALHQQCMEAAALIVQGLPVEKAVQRAAELWIARADALKSGAYTCDVDGDPESFFDPALNFSTGSSSLLPEIGRVADELRMAGYFSR